MSKKKQYMIFGAIAIVVVGFFVIRANSDRFAADERLQLEITSPATRTPVTDAEIIVAGIISNATAAVKVNGTPVDVSADGGFSQDIVLEYGQNRVAIEAEGEGLRSTTRTVSVTRQMVLEVLEPVQDSVSAANTITVSGTVSDTAATVMVAGTDVPVAEDGTWTMQMMLYYPLTVIDVTARRDGIDPINELINVNFERS